MAWLDDRAATEDHAYAAPGLWAMNDAGWDHPLATPGTKLIAWFQVEISAVADDQPLPVQPFLQCAESVTARVGTMDLSAVQLLMPVHSLDPSARPPYATVPSMQTRHWFTERDPRTKTPVEVSINSGLDPLISAVAEQLSDRLGHLGQNVFVCSSPDVASRADVPPPPFEDSFWHGPPRHDMVLHGELVEWSCDAVGWLAEVVADLAAQLGVRSPLLLTVTRAPSTG